MSNRNYNDPLYKQWRKYIYSRDNHSCQWPGCFKKNKLNAHHIYKWSEYPGLRYHTDNGITLCRYHHDLIKDNESSYSGFFSRLVAQKKT